MPIYLIVSGVAGLILGLYMLVYCLRRIKREPSGARRFLLGVCAGGGAAIVLLNLVSIGLGLLQLL